MKARIHPNWNPETQVTCACGNTFTIGSTSPKIHVEVCFKCHPFYTGENRFVDTKGRVERFQDLQARKSEFAGPKKDRRKLKRLLKIQEEQGRPENLAELRKSDK